MLSKASITKQAKFRCTYSRYAGITACLILMTCVPSAYAQWTNTNLVQNGGFEANGLPATWPYYTGTISSWSLTGSHMINDASGPFHDRGAIPQGTYVAGTQGAGAFDQNISGLVNGQVYRLDLFVNERYEDTGIMSVRLWMGNQVLYGPTQIGPMGSYAHLEIPFTYYSSWGNTLRLETLNPTGDSTILFDDVKILTPVQYTVAYNADPAAGGALSGASSINHPDTPGNTITITANANTGYSLNNVTATNGTPTQVNATTYTLAGVTANTTVTGHFTANTYTVSFNANGGATPSVPSKNVTYNSAYGALATTTRTGYDFDGWFTAASGGTQVTATTTVTTTANHTVYAHWTPKTYTVTFDAQGGSAPSPASKSVTYNVSYGTLATTTRTGYNFEGWFTAASGGTEVAAITTMTTATDHTLYAQWTPITSTVTFDAQGGDTPSPASKSVTYNATYGTLATTARAGYAFDGWFTAASGGTEVTDATTVSATADHTLYAQWTVQSYTVTFDAQGGSTPSLASKSVTYDTAYGALATTALTGYNFDGWFTAASGGTQVTDATTMTTAADHTLYAQWTPITSTATFDAQGGDAPSTASKSVTYGTAYGALATTARTGYDFDGWFTAASGGTEVTDITTVSATADHTLYAQWTPKTYTVSFEAEGGERPDPVSTTVTYGAAYGALATTARTGYDFDGWFTAASGGTQVSSTTTVATATDHTLYAQWTPATYTITFDAQGGEEPTPTSTTATYDTAYGTLATTTRTGYDFNGWFTAASGGTQITAATTMATAANHRLYAQWTPKTYTVTFDANGGSTANPTSKQVTYDDTYGTLAETTLTGQILTGWYTAATGGTLITDTTTMTTAADHTLYAQWVANAHTVTYIADPVAGGSITGAAGIAHDGLTGDTITVTITANSGWTLDSVNASNGAITLASGDDYTLSGVTTDTTITATFLEETAEGEGEEGEGEEGEGEVPNCEVNMEASVLATVGDDICFVVENACNALDGDFTWTFTPADGSTTQTIPDAPDAQYCLTDVQLEDAGTYEALFENGQTKALATYTVILSVDTALPVSSLLALLLSATLLTLLGAALTLRRRSH